MRADQSAILTYHSIDRSGSVISIAPDVFEDQMAWLAESGLAVVPLEEAVKTAGGVALTFDDGYQNFLDVALPVLEGYRFPSTVFAATGVLGKTNEWDGQHSSIPELAIMSTEGVREAATRGVEFGAHGVTHADLTALGEDEIERELTRSRAQLEDLTGKPVRTFAYPFGRMNEASVRLAGRSFELACGTRLGYVRPGSDLLELPRLDVYHLRSRFWFRRLADATGRAYIQARAALRG